MPCRSYRGVMDLLTVWFDASTDGLPDDLVVWDAHAHTGSNDPDGVVGTAEGLLDALDQAGHQGSVVMSSREPAGYRHANDRVLAEAKASAGRLVPFLRIDPRRGDDAVEELDRCIAAGFRGLKLHPRGENFSFALPVMDDIAARVAQARIPMLIHAGRGIPPLAEDIEAMLRAHPDLTVILGHAGISDLGRLCGVWADHPGMFFDLAWWSMPSLLALASRVPADRLLHASDTPYGSPLMAGAMAARVASAAGWEDDEIRNVMGGNLGTLLDGRRPEPVRAPQWERSEDPLLLAAHADLNAAIAQILAGGPGAEALQLAARACVVEPGHRHAEVLDAVRVTIDIVDTATPNRATAIRTLIVAAGSLLTPEASVPEL